MKMKYFPEPGYFELPADSSISNADILTSIYYKAIQGSERKITIDVSKVYWISPFTACWLAA